MVITPHSLVGALAGRRSSSLAGAFIAGVTSHFMLDKVPHYDYSLEGVRGKATAASEFALVLGLLGRRGWNLKEIAGAAGGIAPDVICVLEREGRLPRLLTPYHDRSHTSQTLPAAISVPMQALVGAAALALLPDE